MLRIFAIALVGVLALPLTHANVLTLTAENFDRETAAAGESCIIDIYAPWCGHCKQLAPVWEALSSRLEGEVKVAKIDATEQTSLRDRFFASSYPMIVLLRDGETRVYRGSRGLEQLEAWALEGWRASEPVAFYKAPNSSFGRYLGLVLGAPSRVLGFMKYLQDVWHFSQFSIGLLFLGGPLAMGVLAIVALDRWALHSADRNVRTHQHQN